MIKSKSLYGLKKKTKKFVTSVVSYDKELPRRGGRFCTITTGSMSVHSEF